MISLTSTMPLAEQTTLRTSYYHQNVPPQLLVNAEGIPNGGILYDLTHAIAKHSNFALEMIPIPRKRISQALKNSLIDLHCVANPLWYKAEDFQWSEVLYKNPDVLINNLGLTSLKQLPLPSIIFIGSTLGYVYPEFTTLEEQGAIQLIDSLGPEESYKRYRKGDTQGYISAQIEASYFDLKDTDSTIVLNDNSIHCIYSPKLNPDIIARLNNAITQLKSTGTIQHILDKYLFSEQNQARINNG
jgi:ABC-type amino acid transport substrate-binding protein